MSGGPVPLAELMVTDRPAGAPVARDTDGPVDWQTFTEQAAALAAALASRGGRRWMVVCDSSYAFAVGLAAVWGTAGTVVLPPNAQTGSVGETAAGIDGIVTDTEVRIEGIPGLHPLGHPRRPFAWKTLEREGTCLELCTSGSTGARKTVPKGIGHLQAEIAVLERRFGGDIGDAEILSTVSHQHIYGLLYRVLWPLCAGRAFRATTTFFPHDLVVQVRECGRACLVSGPAHLKRLPELIDLSCLGECCGALFSSGGLFETADARAFLDHAGVAPYEVLGSTETGGVAWRRQDHRDESRVWHALEDVEVAVTSEEEFLRVRSPYVSVVPPGEWFTMGDRVRLLSPTEFLLLGRGDRIVKIEEERLSLPDMEERLREHRSVKAAAVFPVRTSASSAARTQLAAAIVPADTRAGMPAADERRGITGALRKHLLSYYPAVLVPRLWRFVEDLPRDSQGKVTLEELRKLVGSGAAHD